MAWEARIAWIAPDRLEVAVAFTESVTRQTVTHRFQTEGTVASLAPQVRAAIARVTAASVSDLVDGALVDVTPPVVVLPPEPTAADLLRLAFRRKLHRARQAQEAVAVGFMQATDALVLTALSEAQAAFRPAYLDLL